MIEYTSKYHSLSPGLFVEIHNDQVEIHNSRYNNIAHAELYFHEVIINFHDMKVVMLGKDKEVISIIKHAERIRDMRDDNVE